MLEAGADKVSITSAVVQNPLIEEGAKEFGSSCIIAAIDAKEWEQAAGTSLSTAAVSIRARTCSNGPGNEGPRRRGTGPELHRH